MNNNEFAYNTFGFVIKIMDLLLLLFLIPLIIFLFSCFTNVLERLSSTFERERVCLFVASMSKLEECLETYIKGLRLSDFPLSFSRFQEKKRKFCSRAPCYPSVRTFKPSTYSVAFFKISFTVSIRFRARHPFSLLYFRFWFFPFSFALFFWGLRGEGGGGSGGGGGFPSVLIFTDHLCGVGSTLGRFPAIFRMEQHFPTTFKSLPAINASPSVWFVRCHEEDDGDAPLSPFKRKSVTGC